MICDRIFLQKMDNVYIIPIGSGSTGNCFYVEIGNYKFLIDMGIGYNRCKAALNKHERRIEDLDAVFVTHGHHDHVKAAPAICNHIPCKVYTNKSVLYSLHNAKAEKIVLERDETAELFDDFKVRMFSLPHDFAYTYGFTFESADTRVSYVTDCGMMSKRIFNEIKDSAVIIIETNHDIQMLKNGPYPLQLQKRILSAHGHLSNDDCAIAVSKLKEAGCSNFLLAHISRHNNTPEMALHTVRSLLNDDTIYLYACLEEGDDLLHFQ